MANNIKQLNLHPDKLSLEKIRIGNNTNYDMINFNFQLADNFLQNVQTQLDTIVVEGDSSPAADQARVDESGFVHSSLQSRLNASDASLAQTKHNRINIQDFKHLKVDDDWKDALSACVDALPTSGGEIIINEDIFLSSGISKKNKNIKITGNGVKISGNGVALTFDSDVSASVSCSDILESEGEVASTLQIAAGEYIEINGDIWDQNYITDDNLDGWASDVRYPNMSFVAKVISVASGVIKLDRKIQYNLKNVTAKKILNPYSIIIDGIKLNGVAIVVNRSIGSSIKISSDDRGLTINKSCDFTVSFIGTNLRHIHGFIMNDVNNFNVDVIFSTTGDGEFSDGSAAYLKSIRGNGLQNGFIKGIFNSSLKNDMTIYSFRNLKIDINSIGSGRYNRENSITDGNRLESIQFSEGKDIRVFAEIVDTDDQGIEFLSVERGYIKPKITTLSGSTEGAIVIKARFKDIVIDTPILRVNNNYAIKLEYGSNPVGNVKIVNPDIESTQGGVVVRDKGVVGAHDCDVSVHGGKIKAQTPIIAFDDHNNVKVYDTVVETTGGHAITVNGNSIVDNVRVVGGDTGTIRSVVVNGTNTKVKRVSGDGFIYIRPNGQVDFNIKNFLFNQVPEIFFDGLSGKQILCADGIYKISNLPSIGTWNAGFIFYRNNPTTGQNLGWRCIQTGEYGTATEPVWETIAV